jgi:hypothetical protein
MSHKELLEESNKLLASKWTEEENILIKRMLDMLNFYNYLIPKTIKQDIKSILEMANRIKCEYDELKSEFDKYKQDFEISINRIDEKEC